MTADINQLLKLYLGADQNGGYEPLYREERLRKAFPNDHERMLELMAPYLNEDPPRDWTRDLVEERDRFEAKLRQKFPELDAISARVLANRWSFDWK